MVAPAGTASALACYLCGQQAQEVLTETLRDRPGRALYCAACELGQLADRPADLRKYYDETYRQQHSPAVHRAASYEEIFQSYAGYQGRRLGLLRPWLRPDMAVLDVGCSTGHFLHAIKPFVREVVGVDYDSGAAAYAAKAVGCTAYGCGLQDTGLPPASFDLVCAMQTMEHVEDPVAFAALLGRYLKPGGLLYIEVPNLQDALLSVFANPAYRTFYFRDAHLFYFTPNSLAAVLARAGFTGTIQSFQDYNFLNHLHWALRETPQPTCHDGLGEPRWPGDGGSPALRADLQAWAREADAAYRALLVRHGVADNIAFIGRAAHATGGRHG